MTVADDLLQHHPETILYGGTIRTVDEADSVAEAVAIRDGRFLAVGDTDEVRDLAGPETDERDLDGRTVIPGLIDSHLHLRQVGMDLDRVTLFDARRIADVLDAVEAEASSLPDGEWVLGGWGWHESQLDEERLPTRSELDEVAPDNPVFVPRGAHVAVVNTAAMELAGIDDDRADPDGGTIVRNPDTGKPNGVFLENARTELLEPVLPERGVDEYVADVERAMDELNSRGVTAAMEPGLEREELRAFQRVAVDGDPTVRTNMYVRVYEPDDVRDAGSYFHTGFGNEMLKVGGVKYMLDGGVEGARLSDPYRVVDEVQEQEDYHGHFLLPEGGEDALFEVFELAAERDHQVQTHVVGDAAIELLVDAYEAADEVRDIEPLRWTAMHVFLPTDDQIARMKDLGVLPTVQNHSTYLGRNMELLWGEERAAEAIPIRTLLDAGLTVGGGTDAPVVPWFPFESIWWMVTRNTVTAGTLGPEEAIEPEEALRLWTRDAAYTMHWEDEIGSIEPGKRADLAVLDRDVVTCDPEAIRDTEVELTMVGGDVVHDA
ncbi:amidohydrolase [Halorubellus sp. JP-L1]|uniref:amidohydrolase n=1 Tax=Halorubellus sp. JP-L1 TaxID=2715753 RepID=UPI0014079651|nr:amidohydrolase [Halorubellus sp. JP-L1]NHN42906.1 amidohydrolase [Halorubellus sp. JP-L1]